MQPIQMLLPAVMLVCGCSSVSVKRDYDASVDFGAWKTYAWQHEQQPKTGYARVDNDLLDRRIRTAVEDELQAKGFEKALNGAVDFTVAYFIEYKQRLSGNTWVFGLGSWYGDGYGSVGYNTSINEYDEAWLTIDFLDAKNAKTAWRGVGVRYTYDDPDPEKVTEIVNKAVVRILAGFPPDK